MTTLYSLTEIYRMEQSKLIHLIEEGKLKLVVEAEWEEDLSKENTHTCPICYYKANLTHSYCPGCGADMRKFK